MRSKTKFIVAVFCCLSGLLTLSCQILDAEFSLKRESPSYVVKRFWRAARENNVEKAQLMVSKGDVLGENENGRHNEFYTPEFIRLLQTSGGQMESICECEADASFMTKVILKTETENGGEKFFSFILTNQNAEKVWKIAWVSENDANNFNCRQH